jgi:hypothetical protein
MVMRVLAGGAELATTVGDRVGSAKVTIPRQSRGP